MARATCVDGSVLCAEWLGVAVVWGPLSVQVPSFFEMHQMRSFMIAPTAIIAGLGQSLDMGAQTSLI